MSLTVIYRETAQRDLARIRRRDRQAFARARRAALALAECPDPEGAVPWGGTGIFRLHAGDVRVLYEVDEQSAAVYILSVALAGS